MHRRMVHVSISFRPLAFVLKAEKEILSSLSCETILSQAELFV